MSDYSDMTILIVDDEEDMRVTLQATIKKIGVNVLTAADGEKALDVMGENIVDVCMIDILMPKMNGFDLLKEINMRYPGTTSLILSAFSDEEYVKQAIMLDAYDFIGKPFQKDVLLNRIKNALNNVKQQKTIQTLMRATE